MQVSLAKQSMVGSHPGSCCTWGQSSVLNAQLLLGSRETKKPDTPGHSNVSAAQKTASGSGFGCTWGQSSLLNAQLLLGSRETKKPDTPGHSNVSAAQKTISGSGSSCDLLM